MLFNSYVFIFAFLPLALFGFYLTGKYSHGLASLWLAAASLFFYGWWDVRYVGLLACSIVFNYGAGLIIGHRGARQLAGSLSKKVLVGAIGIDLLLLGYFKYAGFFARSLTQVTGTSLQISEVVLPLGISFFTFTQIAFLVDTFQGKVKQFNFVRYGLFVTYFPHLIAGPILHHSEMMPQFARRSVCHVNLNNVAVGLSIFALGLAKKVLLADSLGEFSIPFFSEVASGKHPMLFDAWTGVLAYTLQLYFDFSAYCDMAIGLSLMFNVRLPMNFNSPYKATSIIDFWRRWHMTLSRFLRDYLYIPLGGSRNGKAHRYVNLTITMLLGGLWHGAGWTFVIWGGLHGIYLIVNHAWRGLKQSKGWGDGGYLATLGAGALTFLAVLVGWVFFRANSFTEAVVILQGMVGMNGVSLPTSLQGTLEQYLGQRGWIYFDGLGRICSKNSVAVLSVGFGIVWLMPNVRQLFQAFRPVCEDMEMASPATRARPPEYSELAAPRTKPGGMDLRWRPTARSAILIGALFFVALIFVGSNHNAEFLYFQF